MSNVWQVTRYLHTWQPLLRWFLIVGAWFCVPGILLALSPADFPALTRFLLVVGTGLALFVPLIPMPTAVRDLLTNRQLKLVPGLHQAVGLAVLGQTVFLAGVVAMAAVAEGNDGIKAAAQTFVAVSLYHLVMQRFLSSRLLPFLLIVSIFGFVGFIRVAEDLSATGWFERTPVLAATAAMCVGWAYALHRLRQQTLFAHAPPDHMSIAIASVNRTGQKLVSSNPIGRLLGYPTTLRERLATATVAIFVSPVVAAGFALAALILVGRLADEHPELRTAWVFDFAGGLVLAISLVNGWLASSSTGLVQRTRLLWLRHAVSRDSLWRMLEGLVLKNLVGYYVVALLTSGVVFFSAVARPYIGVYLTAMVSGSLLSAYFSINVAVGRPMLAYALVSGVVGITFVVGLLMGASGAVWISQTAALLMAWLLRGEARQAFEHLDWSTVRPGATNRRRMTTVKLW